MHSRRMSESEYSIVSSPVERLAERGRWFCEGSINSRVNILYFLDSLCETCLVAKSHPNSLGVEGNTNGSFYVDFVARDLRMIVECVVPEGRQGLPNLTSTKQVRSSIIINFNTHITIFIVHSRYWRTGAVKESLTHKRLMTL